MNVLCKGADVDASGVSLPLPGSGNQAVTPLLQRFYGFCGGLHPLIRSLWGRGVWDVASLGFGDCG
jgi:hypothetical protein